MGPERGSIYSVLFGLFLLGNLAGSKATANPPGHSAQCKTNEECDDLNPCNGYETCQLNIDFSITVCVQGTPPQMEAGVTCNPSQCGNGIVETGEECDDANNLNGDGCNTCVLPECEEGATDNACDPAVDGCTVGVDPDCNPEAEKNQAGLGLCAGGSRSCLGGIWGYCVAYTPVEESCEPNNVDDNCDGSVDNADPSMCQTCQPSSEICDGLDNNCNGQIDDGPDSDNDGISDICDKPEEETPTENGEAFTCPEGDPQSMGCVANTTAGGSEPNVTCYTDDGVKQLSFSGYPDTTSVTADPSGSSALIWSSGASLYYIKNVTQNNVIQSYTVHRLSLDDVQKIIDLTPGETHLFVAAQLSDVEGIILSINEEKEIMQEAVLDSIPQWIVTAKKDKETLIVMTEGGFLNFIKPGESAELANESSMKTIDIASILSYKGFNFETFKSTDGMVIDHTLLFTIPEEQAIVAIDLTTLSDASSPDTIGLSVIYTPFETGGIAYRTKVNSMIFTGYDTEKIYSLDLTGQSFEMGQIYSFNENDFSVVVDDELLSGPTNVAGFHGCPQEIAPQTSQDECVEEVCEYPHNKDDSDDNQTDDAPQTEEEEADDDAPSVDDTTTKEATEEPLVDNSSQGVDDEETIFDATSSGEDVESTENDLSSTDEGGSEEPSTSSDPTTIDACNAMGGVVTSISDLNITVSEVQQLEEGVTVYKVVDGEEVPVVLDENGNASAVCLAADVGYILAAGCSLSSTSSSPPANFDNLLILLVLGGFPLIIFPYLRKRNLL